MEQKELIDLIIEQIKARDKIIDKLLNERKSLINIQKVTLFKDFAPYIVIIVWTIFYFCTTW